MKLKLLYLCSILAIYGRIENAEEAEENIFAWASHVIGPVAPFPIRFLQMLQLHTSRQGGHIQFGSFSAPLASCP